MGIKRKRVSISKVIYKNNKMYAKDSNRIREVCKCMVYFRNCMKCNIKLAKRHSDYISLMIKHCREASETRKRTRPHENHDFCTKTFYKMIYNVILESNMLCQCDLCIKNKNIQKLSIRGKNKLSLDRIYDNIGYTHENQELRLISKSHHSWQKRNSIPIVSPKRNWMSSVKSKIIKRSELRYKKLQDEIDNVEQAGIDTDQLKQQLKSHIINIEEIDGIIRSKKENNPNCQKCNIELDYGDKNGYVFTNNESRRASPDRINNRIGYIESNIRMVCFACQTMETIDDREDLFLTESEFYELLEYIKNKIETFG